MNHIRQQLESIAYDKKTSSITPKQLHIQTSTPPALLPTEQPTTPTPTVQATPNRKQRNKNPLPMWLREPLHARDHRRSHLAVMLLMLGAIIGGLSPTFIPWWLGYPCTTLLMGSSFVVAGWSALHLLIHGGSLASILKAILTQVVILTVFAFALSPQYVYPRSRANTCMTLQPIIEVHQRDIRNRLLNTLALSEPQTPGQQAQSIEDRARFLTGWRTNFDKLTLPADDIHKYTIEEIVYLTDQLIFRLKAWAKHLRSTEVDALLPVANPVRYAQRTLYQLLRTTEQRCNAVRHNDRSRIDNTIASPISLQPNIQLRESILKRK